MTSQTAHLSTFGKGKTMTVASFPRTALPSMTDQQQHQLLFAATFVIFLVAVVTMRLGRMLGGITPDVRKSIVAEARETAHSTLALAFMG